MHYQLKFGPIHTKSQHKRTFLLRPLLLPPLLLVLGGSDVCADVRVLFGLVWMGGFRWMGVLAMDNRWGDPCNEKDLETAL